jgi:hypothetical protein
MDDTLPNFFMTSSEDSRLKPIRKCYIVKRFRAEKRDDYLLVEISPPLDINSYGIQGNPLNKLVLASRHKGVSLFPIKKWPVAVYVLQALIENPEQHDVLRKEEMALLGWAEIYDSQLNIY